MAGKEKVSAALHIFRDEGASALLAKLRYKADVWLKCFAARGIKSVTFDGCTFSLEMMPSNAMKVSLLKKKYERIERHAVLQYVRPEYPVVELGACIGVVSCVTNRALKNPRAHVVVEANPNVIPILRNNRDCNQCEFEILNMAIAYDQPTVTFSPATDFRGTSLRANIHQPSANPLVTVAAAQLGRIVEQRGYDCFTLICDIEGHEYELVQREQHILHRVDTLILETHARLIGEDKNRAVLEKLADIGFRTIDQDSCVLVMRRNPRD